MHSDCVWTVDKTGGRLWMLPGLFAQVLLCRVPAGQKLSGYALFVRSLCARFSTEFLGISTLFVSQISPLPTGLTIKITNYVN
jgi:hypothetical protein